MVYAYVRVSTKDQSVERQIDSIKKFYPDIPKKNIYIEKDSGKNNNRSVYQKLINRLKKNDELIIHELDRISRNKDFIHEQLAFFKKNKIILRILELPTTMHAFSEETAWVGDMVNNIIIEVYSSLAQQEREKLSKRTKEGLAAARLRGRFAGRPFKDSKKLDLALSLYKQKYSLNEITLMTSVSRYCFYRHLRLKILALQNQGINDAEIIKQFGCSQKYLQEVRQKGMSSYQR